jgi:hypothetical protein
MNQQVYKKLGYGQPALWIDFLNSLEHDGRGNTRDYLRDPQWRKVFQSYWKLAAPPGEAVPFRSLERLRALLRKIADGLHPKFTLRPNELRALNDALNVAVKPRLFQSQIGQQTGRRDARRNNLVLREIPEKTNWRWIAAQIAQSCAETLTSSSRERVKICPDTKCQWIFYDQSKAKSRIWCNEKTCGNRNRVRRARGTIA